MLGRLEAQVDDLEQKYGDGFRHDYGWAAHAFEKSKVTFYYIEKAVKLSFMRPLYRMASEQVHASVGGALKRTGVIDQRLSARSLLTGPSSYSFADTASCSAQSLLIATGSLLQVGATIDSNVLSSILAQGLDPLRLSFLKAQLSVEERDRRLRGKVDGRHRSSKTHLARKKLPEK